MNWVDLAFFACLLFILFLANIYMLAHNAHSNDTPMGKNIFMRMIVVILSSIYCVLGFWIRNQLLANIVSSDKCGNDLIRFRL